MPAELIEVAESGDLWNGVVCTQEGRLFASMPGWIGPTPGVVEVFPDGGFKPFPGNEWNAWAEGTDPARSFVDVNSVIADGKGSLWVLDAAAPHFGEAIEGVVKVVELDIATGQTKRVQPAEGGRHGAHGHCRQPGRGPHFNQHHRAPEPHHAHEHAAVGGSRG